MKPPPKLSSADRRAAIIQAVRQVFAAKGFDGTTTRELARAAGVSEALLFKHFPNKEALYTAMQRACCQEAPEKRERLAALEPTAATLVFLVHLLVSHIVGDDDEDAVQTRLMLRSMLEDGEFARLTLQRLAAGWVPKVEECLRGAIAAGDAVAGPGQPAVQGWFTQHLAASVMIHLLPGARVVDYGVSRPQLIEQTVWFALRGMGLKEAVIKRHCNPQALARMAAE